MNNKERSVNEGRTQKLGDKMTTLKTLKTGLNFFDAKQFYVYDIKSYPHVRRLYLFGWRLKKD